MSIISYLSTYKYPNLQSRILCKLCLWVIFEIKVIITFEGSQLVGEFNQHGGYLKNSSAYQLQVRVINTSIDRFTLNCFAHEFFILPFSVSFMQTKLGL